MTQVYKVLAVLLEYPRKELVENWDEMQQIVAALPNLAEEDKSSLTDFIASAADLSLTKLQAQYVDSFDMTAENSLYLTYHYLMSKIEIEGLL